MLIIPRNNKVLALVFIVDSSSSMSHVIGSVEQCLKDLMVEIHEWSTPKALDVEVTVINFADEAFFLIGSEMGGVPIDQVNVPCLTANGQTAMSEGVRLAATMLERSYDVNVKYSKPGLILISDGYATDGRINVDDIDETPLGRASTRLAIAFGEDVDTDELKAFMTPALALELGVMSASSTNELTRYIRDATFVAMENKSSNSIIEGEKMVV